MTHKKFTLIGIGIYLIIATAITLYYLFTKLTLWNYLNAILPGSLCLLIIFFYGYVGLHTLLAQNERRVVNFLKIVLWMQIIQFSFFGLVYENYLGPYIGLGLYFTPVFKFDTKIEMGSWFANGYSSNSDSKLFVNCLPLILLLIVNDLFKMQRKEVQNKFAK